MGRIIFEIDARQLERRDQRRHARAADRHRRCRYETTDGHRGGLDRESRLLPPSARALEAALRALLGGWPERNRAASDVAARVVAAIGTPNGKTAPRLGWLLPTAKQVAAAGVWRLHELGMPPERAETLTAIATRVADGTLRLDVGHDPEVMRRHLPKVEGVHEQLAAIVVMRALSWPDAFPLGDDASSKCRPWGAYALMHLWLDGKVVLNVIDQADMVAAPSARNV